MRLQFDIPECKDPLWLTTAQSGGILGRRDAVRNNNPAIGIPDSDGTAAWSRSHARFDWEDGAWHITLLTSQRTLLNGRQLTQGRKERLDQNISLVVNPLEKPASEIRIQVEIPKPQNKGRPVEAFDPGATAPTGHFDPGATQPTSTPDWDPAATSPYQDRPPTIKIDRLDVDKYRDKLQPIQLLPPPIPAPVAAQPPIVNTPKPEETNRPPQILSLRSIEYAKILGIIVSSVILGGALGYLVSGVGRY